MTQIFALLVFIFGYALITLEHNLKISKSAVALVTGALLWTIVAFSNTHFETELIHAGSEIFGLVVFLLAAMSLVEILVHYRFFDIIRGKLYKLGLTEQKQFAVIIILTFFLSAVVDNLTCTIVMVQIARNFFVGTNLIRAVAGIVIAANAGGAFSPIGDVTTIMLWLADKFTAIEILTRGFLPSLTMLTVLIAFMYPKFRNIKDDTKNEIVTTLGKSEKIIIAGVFGSFMLPVMFNQIHLPPYLGLLLGLGLVWLIIDLFKQIRPKPTHLEASIDEFIKKTDIPSLKFFIGILLAVSALANLGILESASHFLYGEEGSIIRVVFGNIGLGVLSAIVDNVPLTAIAIDVLPTTNSSLWVLLALTVGTGGSLLVIGSAAGVIAMGMVKELSFGSYLKHAFVPALAGYVAGISVWAIQYFVFGF